MVKGSTFATKRLEGYLGEFPAKPLLREQEKEFIQSAQSGDTNARNALILHEMFRIHGIAKKYCSPYDSRFASLMSIGVFGLIEAITRFDVERGYRLGTYANAYIKKYILMELQAEYRETLLLSQLGEEAEQIRETVVALKEKPAEQALAALFQHTVLTTQERWILDMHYTQNVPLASIGKLIHRTGERVRQIEASALEKLFVSAQSKNMATFNDKHVVYL